MVARFGIALAVLLIAPSASADDTPPATVHVRVSSPRPVPLFHARPKTQAWVLACQSPCEADIPVGDDLRVDSKEIALDAAAGQSVEVVVDPQNKTMMTTGLVVGGIGALVSTVGLAYLALSVISGAVGGGECSERPVDPVIGTSRAECEKNHDKTDSLRTIGLVLAGAGLVPMIVGLVLYLPASRTSVTTRPTASRLPAWREVGALSHQPDGAPAAAFPLQWRASF